MKWVLWGSFKALVYAATPLVAAVGFPIVAISEAIDAVNEERPMRWRFVFAEVAKGTRDFLNPEGIK